MYGPQAGFGPPHEVSAVVSVQWYPQWCVQWCLCSGVCATVPLPTGKSLSPCGGVVCGECTAVCVV